MFIRLHKTEWSISAWNVKYTLGFLYKIMAQKEGWRDHLLVYKFCFKISFLASYNKTKVKIWTFLYKITEMSCLKKEDRKFKDKGTYIRFIVILKYAKHESKLR